MVPEFGDLGKVLFMVGAALMVLGLFLSLVGHVPWLNLPGDIHIRREKFSFYFPLTTSILISLFLSLLLTLFFRKR